MYSMFYSYFDRRRKPGYVDLVVANIYGYMKTGKTVLTRKIAARIEDRCRGKEWGFLYIEGRRQSDVLSYILDNRDEVRGMDYVMVSYDDAGRWFLSREGLSGESRGMVKDFMEIRHKFEEAGFKSGVLAVLTNIQFYKLLDRTIRNAPMSIWKSMVYMDREARRAMVERLGSRYYFFLKVITKAMFIDGYRLKRSDIGTRSSVARERIYNWLLEFFKRYGVNAEEEISMEFVKRFAVVELFDEKFIIDTDNDIVEPESFVKIDPQDDETLFSYRDMLERDRMLAMAVLGYRLGREGYSRLDDVARIIRRTGIRFSHKRIFELAKEIETILENIE